MHDEELIVPDVEYEQVEEVSSESWRAGLVSCWELSVLWVVAGDTRCEEWLLGEDELVEEVPFFLGLKNFLAASYCHRVNSHCEANASL